jgi:hypothetical protein
MSPVSFLSEAEGEKKLYARFMDPAGNISPTSGGCFQLDYTPPVCQQFSIDEDADFTNNPQKQVRLTISAPDAVKMAISNHPITNPADVADKWENYSETKDWILEGRRWPQNRLRTLSGHCRESLRNKQRPDHSRPGIAPTNCSVKINDEKKYVLAGGNKIPYRNDRGRS